jgi:membrane fusion protein (multidrug efflux system)
LNTQRQAASGQLEQARAAQEQADANLARTVIVAPTAGRVTKLSAAKGAYAQVGQSLMMFVPRDVWVTANFKESQLADMRPGQAVDIRVDAYPDRVFHGRVDSIQAGSGAAFSLLPPENATGNYVKVVQRVPVKIVFDKPPDVYLGPGMSVVPDVKVR